MGKKNRRRPQAKVKKSSNNTPSVAQHEGSGANSTNTNGDPEDSPDTSNYTKSEKDALETLELEPLLNQEGLVPAFDPMEETARLYYKMGMAHIQKPGKKDQAKAEFYWRKLVDSPPAKALDEEFFNYILAEAAHYQLFDNYTRSGRVKETLDLCTHCYSVLERGNWFKPTSEFGRGVRGWINTVYETFPAEQMIIFIPLFEANLENLEQCNDGRPVHMDLIYLKMHDYYSSKNNHSEALKYAKKQVHAVRRCISKSTEYSIEKKRREAELAKKEAELVLEDADVAQKPAGSNDEIEDSKETEDKKEQERIIADRKKERAKDRDIAREIADKKEYAKEELRALYILAACCEKSGLFEDAEEYLKSGKAVLENNDFSEKANDKKSDRDRYRRHRYHRHSHYERPVPIRDERRYERDYDENDDYEYDMHGFQIPYDRTFPMWDEAMLLEKIGDVHKAMAETKSCKESRKKARQNTLANYEKSNEILTHLLSQHNLHHVGSSVIKNLQKLTREHANNKEWDKAKQYFRRGLDLAEGHKFDSSYYPGIDREEKSNVNELEFAAAVNRLNDEYGRIVLDQYLDSNHFEQREEHKELLEEAYQIHSRNLPQDFEEIADVPDIEKSIPSLVYIDLATESYFMSQVNADKERHETDAFRYLGLHMEIAAGSDFCAGCHQIHVPGAVTKVCSACNMCYYCNDVCQNRHWKSMDNRRASHKALCPAMKELKGLSGEVIRHLFSNSENNKNAITLTHEVMRYFESLKPSESRRRFVKSTGRIDDVD